ncbi:CDP-diacylglycerol--serine O-phosphatidyltransferase, partial [Thioclava sp. BHET1]
LMISRIPTWSVKSVTIHRENARLFLIGAVAVVTLLVSYPWITMAALDIAYMLGILWSWRVAKKG